MNEQIVNFIPISKRVPNLFEECILLDINGRLSVGCWISINEENKTGYFRQGGCGEYEKDEIVAWIPIENYRLSKGYKLIFCYDNI